MLKRLLIVVGCFVLLGAALSLSARAQEREFTLKMNAVDLQILDAAINKAPLPREQTQPFIERMQKQIVEQSKPKDAPITDANGNPVPNTVPTGKPK